MAGATVIEQRKGRAMAWNITIGGATSLIIGAGMSGGPAALQLSGAPTCPARGGVV